MKKLLPIILCALFYTSEAQNALNLDGNNDYISTSYSGVSGQGARTIEAIIRTSKNSLPSASGQSVIADYGSFTNGGRFTFNILWSNSIRIEVGGSGLSGTTAVNDGNWHHVAVVYDNSATNNFSLYIDGNLETSGNLATSVSTGSSINLRIGLRVDGVNPFDGDIQEVRMYDYAKTSAEINASKDMALCPPSTGLVAYYSMNQGRAAGNNPGVSTAIDLSGNNNNGTLNGFALSGTSSNWILGKTLQSNGSSYTLIEDTICKGQPYVFNGASISMAGTYSDTFALASGCDSIIELNIEIDSIDAGVLVLTNFLRANNADASYQWIRCSDNSVLVGDTNRIYIPTDNDSYAVIVDDGNCPDTSICVSLMDIGLNDFEYNSFAIYPNPSGGQITIEKDNSKPIENLSIYNLQGQLLYELGEINGLSRSFSLNLKTGIYILQADYSGSTQTQLLKIQ